MRRCNVEVRRGGGTPWLPGAQRAPAQADARRVNPVVEVSSRAHNDIELRTLSCGSPIAQQILELLLVVLEQDTAAASRRDSSSPSPHAEVRRSVVTIFADGR